MVVREVPTSLLLNLTNFMSTRLLAIVVLAAYNGMLATSYFAAGN